MRTLQIDTFGTATIAMCVFFVGKAIVARSKRLQAYSIPEPVIGGFASAIIIALIHYIADTDIVFDLFRRDIFLVYFFAALGWRSSVRQLISGWRPLFILVAVTSAFLFLQNEVGIGLATAFDLHPKLGIAAGSMALTGRAGTTVAWASVFQEQFGISISRVGIGANMAGLIAACCLGGPMAKFLIKRHRLETPGPSADLDVGISRNFVAPQLDYHGFLLALLCIHVTVIVGQLLNLGLDWAGVQMPLYVLCLAAGVALGNIIPLFAPKLEWQSNNQGLALISDVSLGLFYSMTLMSMQLWAVEGIAGFIIVLIACQVLLTTLYTILVVFPLMGRDYQAAVISAGFVGVTLGSTATTMAIMTAVAGQYGRAHRAFVIVPFVCGFFIDIVNSLVIMFLVGVNG